MPEAANNSERSKPSELYLADTGVSGKILDERGAVLLYHEDFQKDSVVGGIATREPFNVCQLSLADATRLRDALDVAIKASTPE